MELDNLGDLAEQGSLGCRPVLGNLAGSGKALGNQAELMGVLVCLVGTLPLLTSLSLGEEAVASCIPDQEVETGDEQMDLQDQGRVGAQMVEVCHLEKIHR